MAFGIVFSYSPLASSAWTIGLVSVGKLLTITASIALGIHLFGLMGSCFCGTKGPCFLRFFCWLLILMAMTLFGVGIFMLVESGSRGTAARIVWNELKDDQQATIEVTRHCCGWENVVESPNCHWKDKGTCGPAIITKQRETLVALGALFASLAAVQLLLFGVTSWIISMTKRRRRELKALEEAKSQRRNSKTSAKDQKDTLKPLVTTTHHKY